MRQTAGMDGADTSDDSNGSGETEALVGFLDAQRECVLDILAGLDDEALRTALLPSGWTALGLLQHLAYTERYWFLEIVDGRPAADPWGGPDGVTDPDAEWRVSPGRTASDVVALYRATCSAADDVLRSTALTAPPRHRESRWPPDDVPDVRWVALHMIEETARHAGQLDAWRELLDGRTGLGPR